MSDVFFWVTHLYGIGHLRRAVALTQALRRRGRSVTLVSGGRPVPEALPEGFEILQLPPIYSPDESFKNLLTAEGKVPSDDWRAKRRDLLLQIYRQAQPKLVITEQFPFGRKQLRFELLPLLEAAKKQERPPHIMASVRDLLVQKPAEKTEWMAEIAKQYFDIVMVHGEADFIPFSQSFAQSDQIADKLVYCGYLATPPRERLEETQADPHQGQGSGQGSGEVIVSAGGGAFGYHLLETAITARPLSRFRHHPWRVLAGANRHPGELGALKRLAGPDVLVEAHHPDLPGLLRNCALSISQAGYNTVAEIRAAGAPAVLVPFSGGGESEQLERARLLQASGQITLVEEKSLSPETLAQAIDALRERSGPTSNEDKMDHATTGLDRACALVEEWIALD